MRTYLCGIAFGLAFLVVIAPLLYVGIRLYSAGEMLPDYGLLASKPELVYGRLEDDYKDFKLTMTSLRRPRVLMIGSSRVMQFRASILTECERLDCFYNAGGFMPSTRVALESLKRLPEDGFPAVIVVGIDYWHVSLFPANEHGATSYPTGELSERMNQAFATVRTWLVEGQKDPSRRQMLLTPWLDRPGMGLNARQRGQGFRGDGSFQYPPLQATHSSDPARMKEIIGQARSATGWFYDGNGVDPVSLTEIREIISVARTRGASVIGFTPPFSRQVVAELENSGRHAAWFQFAPAVAKIFSDAGQPFFHYTDMSSAGCEEDESIDGYHPNERCSAKIILTMLRDANTAAILRAYVHSEKLRADIRAMTP